MNIYAGRLGLQQRVLPSYRVPFFDLLVERCKGGLSVFAGDPLVGEGIQTARKLTKAKLFKTKNLHFMTPSSSAYLCWQKGVIDWLEAWNPDSLVLEANGRYLSSLLIIHWMHQQQKPVLGWGLGAPRTGNLLESFFRVRFLGLLDGLIAYSKRGVSEYRQLGLKNVFLAYNAVASRPEWKCPVRRKDKQGPLTILFVGRLQERKRIDILLEACRTLPESIQPQLVIVGDGPALEKYSTLAKTIYPQTDFPGAVYGQELTEYFLSADLFVLPGTGGLAVQEAMSYGLPVIVAQGDGTQDDLVTPENGWQIATDDLNGLSIILKEALCDLPTLRRKGAESYRIAFEKVNIQTMVEQFIDAINLTTYQSPSRE